MKCLYCDKEINKYSLYGMFVEEDELCLDCREKLNPKLRRFKIDNTIVEYIYDYDSLFKTLLLQYKECYDEALKDIFLYKYKLYLWIKYHGYKICYVPSTKEKLEERGFHHLKLIFSSLGFKEVDGIELRKELIQEGKTLNERKEMINNYVYRGEKLNKVLIVDDVCTTGSSIRGILKALHGHTKVTKVFVLAKRE